MTIPRATYRLQFRGGMDFDRAAALVPYLARLGISHLYASPVFHARGGSTHGYDVADHAVLDPCLGGEDGWRRLTAALRAHGLGLILDIVPNHMAASTDNPWWEDVLSWGRRSRWAGHFDIDWQAERLLLPVLGEPYGEALEEGSFGLRLDPDGAGVRLGYRDHAFPLSPPTVAALLQGEDDPGLRELGARLAACTPDADPHHGFEAFRATAAAPSGRRLLEAALDAVDADPERLHALHEAQCWRLGHWRLAREMLPYRRFFEIADLVGVRVEDPAVFGDVHARVTALVADGTVDGLRIDHVDGLADPKSYLEALRDRCPAAYVVVEKILMPGEPLPEDWPVDGTTGYELGQLLAGVQVAPRQEAAMTAAWTGFTGEPADFAAAVRDAKRRMLAVNLAGELATLVRLARRIAGGSRRTRDLGPDALRTALVELVAELPVYRTYADADGCPAADARLLGEAGERAKRHPPVEDRRPVDFLVGLVTGSAGTWDEDARAEFVRRFQQATGPVMAKAVEDTVFYRFNRLIALNEVGSEPEPFGLTVAAFHAAVAERVRAQPHGLSATATHDTKRGEDARLRIAMLARDPDGWRAHVERWHAATAALRARLPDGSEAPDPSDEWLFWQSLLGAWPAAPDPAGRHAPGELGDRLEAFMIKALREAKRHTSWTAPDSGYEAAAAGFVRGVLAQPALLADIAGAFAPLIAAGATAALGQLALKLTLPGVPDIYQGTELWDLALVDPDNRRPVDFEARARLAGEAASQRPEQAMARWREGLPKLWLLQRLLDLRREREALFRDGSYEPLVVTGAGAQRLLAFARRLGEEAVIVAVPRAEMDGAAAQVRLPGWARGRDIVDRLTGADGLTDGDALDPASALGRFPVGVWVCRDRE